MKTRYFSFNWFGFYNISPEIHKNICKTIVDYLSDFGYDMKSYLKLGIEEIQIIKHRKYFQIYITLLKPGLLLDECGKRKKDLEKSPIYII